MAVRSQRELFISQVMVVKTYPIFFSTTETTFARLVIADQFTNVDALAMLIASSPPATGSHAELFAFFTPRL